MQQYAWPRGRRTQTGLCKGLAFLPGKSNKNGPAPLSKEWHRFSLSRKGCSLPDTYRFLPATRMPRSERSLESAVAGGKGSAAACQLQKNSTAEGAAATLSLDVLSRCHRLAVAFSPRRRLARSA